MCNQHTGAARLPGLEGLSIDSKTISMCTLQDLPVITASYIVMANFQNYTALWTERLFSLVSAAIFFYVPGFFQKQIESPWITYQRFLFPEFFIISFFNWFWSVINVTHHSSVYCRFSVCCSVVVNAEGAAYM